MFVCLLLLVGVVAVVVLLLLLLVGVVAVVVSLFFVCLFVCLSNMLRTRSKHTEDFKRTLLLDKTQKANFEGNPLYQATK